MKNKLTGFNIIVCAFAACLLVGCGTGTPPASAEHTPTGFPSASPTETEMPTATSTFEFFFPPVVLSVPLRQRCIPISPEEVPWESISSGIVLFQVEYYSYDSLPYSEHFLYDLQTGRDRKVSTRALHLGYWEISPDGTKIAYLAGTDKIGPRSTRFFLETFNAQAEVLSTITFERDDLYSFQWAGNDKLLLDNYLTQQEGTLLVVNPFTFEQHLLRNEMPDFFTGNSPFGLSWRLVYSPDMEWGVYVESSSGDFSGRAFLRDFETNQTLWESDGPVENRVIPLFSPDGSRVAYSDWPVLKVIDRAGNALVIGELDDYSKDYTWSPDSRYLAFHGPDSLMLYDTLNNEIVDPCISVNTDDIWTVLIWSPDSKQIYVSDVLDVGGIVVNMDDLTAYRVVAPRDGVPVGWMKSLP